MVRILQTALMWLLALTLPAQGYAASTLVPCGQALHHAVLAAPMHEHAATGVHHHGALAHDVDGYGAHEQGIAQDDSAADAQSVKAVGAKCSVCAACCSMAAITASVPVVDVVSAAADFGATSFEHRTGVTTGGLERPPRIILA